MLRLVTAVTACALIGWCTLAPSAASADADERAKRPVVLLLPAGGFIFDIETLPYPERTARKLGFQPKVVDYPEWDLSGAVRAVRAAARRVRGNGREVYVYGESAGGTLAALLAEDGRVGAAAVYCPIADLVPFIRRSHDPELYMALIKADEPELRRYSPGLHDSVRPIFAMRAMDDSPFMNQGIRRWDRRDPDAESVAVGGAHLKDPDHPAVYRRNVRRGLTWLARFAGIAKRFG